MVINLQVVSKITAPSEERAIFDYAFDNKKILNVKGVFCPPSMLKIEEGKELWMVLDRIIIFLIAGWSGFFLMSVELLSGRILAPYFGSSIHVWGAILTIFMLALAIGYLIGGRLSVQEPSIKKLSIILLTTAALTTPVVVLGEPTLDRIFIIVQDPRYGSLAAATILFFMPTIIAGMISPYAVRLLVNECRFSGQYAGILYFVSTLGSAGGALVTAFYLVLYLEINQILWLLISVSTIIGLLTLIFSRVRVNE